jgi:hypothetical protein
MRLIEAVHQEVVIPGPRDARNPESSSSFNLEKLDSGPRNDD